MIQRRTLVAILLGLPAVLVALWLVALESWRLREPQSSLFAPPFVFSLADAIERGELLQAHEFLRHRDPDAPIDVRHPDLTGGRALRVSPLLWAVAVGNREAVQMLIGMGARSHEDPGRTAPCLARALGNTDLADLLHIYGAPTEGPCPRADASAPLLAHVSRED